MTTNAQIKKITTVIKDMDDGGTGLAWAAYEADLLTYEEASPPAKSATIAKALVNSWANQDTSDAVGDLLGSYRR